MLTDLAALLDSLTSGTQPAAISAAGLSDLIASARSDAAPAKMATSYTVAGPDDGAGRVRVIRVAGLLNPSVHLPPLATSYSEIVRAYSAAQADPDVSGIALHVSSPGGTVSGLLSALASLEGARKAGGKPVTAIADETMASAAYAISAAGADRIVAATDAASVGSIGVLAAHVDVSAADQAAGEKWTFITSAGADDKALGHAHEPLSAQARAALQRSVDTAAASMNRRITAGRPALSSDRIAATKGRTLTGPDALSAGLIDAIEPAGAALGALMSTTTEDTAAMPVTDNLTAGPAAPAGDGALSRAAAAEIAAVVSEAAALGIQINAAAAIEAGTSPADLRAQAMQEAARRATPAPGVTTDPAEHTTVHVTGGLMHQSGSGFVAGAAEALDHRVHPTGDLSPAGRQFAGASMGDIARACLHRSGKAGLGSTAQLVAGALHGTSDFADILADFARRSLMRAYATVGAPLKVIANETSASDFRTLHRIQGGDWPTFSKVSEHGEYIFGSLGEMKEAYRIDTYGRIVALTRQALVNDDLGMFTRLAQMIGRAAAAFEGDQLFALLDANGAAGPLMHDGVSMFDASRGNTASANAEITAGLGPARAALRKMKSLDGNQYLDLVPTHLIVGPDDEEDARKALAATTPTTTEGANPYSDLRLIVEPRITDDRWYLACANYPGLEFAYLSGTRGPQIEREVGFDVDGVKIKARLDYGCGVIDWRGIYRVPATA